MKTKLHRIATTVHSRLETIFHKTFTPAEESIFHPLLPLAIAEEITALTLRGGKRLRAALIVAGYELFKENALENGAVVDAACAMELLQTYFLVHDDIMDDDPIRRGGPSVHESLRQKTNDPELGTHLGILAGDLACAVHEQILASLKCEANIKSSVHQLFSRMHMDVIYGQTLDLQKNASPLEIVQRKTASYTTIGPLCIGAALAGADNHHLKQIADIGRPMGIAFQFRDDLIGAFGNSDETGKPIGSDIKNGKRTHLLEDALETATPAQRALIDSAFGNNDVTPERMSAALKAVMETGAVNRCEHTIASLCQTIHRCLDASDYRADGIRFTRWLADALAQRNT